MLGAIHRNHTLLLCSLLELGLLAPALAQAQDKRPSQDRDPVISYAFDDHLVGGQGIAPDGEILRVHARKDRESLVRARSEFLVELLKSVEAL